MTNKPDKRGPARQEQPPEAMMAPGDEAPPGTPGTGDDICPTCGGSGKVKDGTCEYCLGRGRIVRGISAGA